MAVLVSMSVEDAALYHLLSLYRLSFGFSASFGISQTPAILTAPGMRQMYTNNLSGAV